MKRTVLPFTHSLQLLEHLIHQHPPKPTILIVCSSKEDFLHQITTAIQTSQAQAPAPEIPASQDSALDNDDDDDDDDDDKDDKDQPEPPTLHPFLTPTLHLLSTSRSIKLIFCPTLPSLRAYLASHSLTTQTQTSDGILVILDLILLHHSTSEFSGQGLSRTLASAVESAAVAALDLQLVECVDEDDPENPARGPRLWNVAVPLLSTSVKLGGDGSSWSGRGAVTVRRVVRRWFTFDQPTTRTTTATTRAEEEMMV